jgi:hypothetical protein
MRCCCLGLRGRVRLRLGDRRVLMTQTPGSCAHACRLTTSDVPSMWDSHPRYRLRTFGFTSRSTGIPPGPAIASRIYALWPLMTQEGGDCRWHDAPRSRGGRRVPLSKATGLTMAGSLPKSDGFGTTGQTPASLWDAPAAARWLDGGFGGGLNAGGNTLPDQLTPAQASHGRSNRRPWNVRGCRSCRRSFGESRRSRCGGKSPAPSLGVYSNGRPAGIGISVP